jgi:cardiolipin synthase
MTTFLPVQIVFGGESCNSILEFTSYEANASSKGEVKPGAGDVLPLDALHPSEQPFSKEQRKLLRNVLWGLLTNSVSNGVRSLFGLTPDGKNMKDLAEQPTTKLEDQILRLTSSLVERGQLYPYVFRLLAVAKKTPVLGKQLKDVTPQSLEGKLEVVAEALTSTAYMRGYIGKGTKYVEWTELSARVEKTLQRQENTRRYKTKNSIQDPLYMQEIMALAKAEFGTASEVRPLVDGTASFKERERMIENAKESIDMMSWAVLDDVTGGQLAESLIRKVQQGVTVRVIIDGQVNRRKGYREALERMEAGGVQVMRWFNPEAPYQGQHRKALIVDGSEMVAGGINPGDFYSHKLGDPKHYFPNTPWVAAEPSKLWRDTDLYVAGPVVNQANKLFAHIWNNQIDAMNLNLRKMNVAEAKPVEGAPSKVKLAVIDHSPNPELQNGSTILLAMLKSIRGAQKTIDIENAYVILFPALFNEIKAAVNRGVRVRVLTNSDTSVDEPIISGPMMRSAVKLAEAGVEVYVKSGLGTLHSKFLVVDSQLALVGSYNLHPRSERMEGEMGLLVNDSGMGRQLTSIVNADVANGKASRLDPKKVEIKKTMSLTVILRLMFDQL